MDKTPRTHCQRRTREYERSWLKYDVTTSARDQLPATSTRPCSRRGLTAAKVYLLMTPRLSIVMKRKKQYSLGQDSFREHQGDKRRVPVLHAQRMRMLVCSAFPCIPPLPKESLLTPQQGSYPIYPQTGSPPALAVNYSSLFRRELWPTSPRVDMDSADAVAASSLSRPELAAESSGKKEQDRIHLSRPSKPTHRSIIRWYMMKHLSRHYPPSGAASRKIHVSRALEGPACCIAAHRGTHTHRTPRTLRRAVH